MADTDGRAVSVIGWDLPTIPDGVARAICPLCSEPCGYPNQVVAHVERIHQRTESEVVALFEGLGIREGDSWPESLLSSGRSFHDWVREWFQPPK